jgi:lysozyme
MIEKLRAQLKRQEDLSLVPYQCSENHWTIGYGHNLDAHGEHIVPGITKEKAEYLLDMDIQQAIIGCQSRIPDFEMLDEVRQAVLVNMAFQMGIKGLLEFKNTLAAIAARDWPLAAKEMLNSLWARQTPGRAAELVQMMWTGEWPVIRGINVN